MSSSGRRNGDIGPQGFQEWVLPVVYFLAKTTALIFVFVWIRATLPRMRYDQLMAFGWKRLIPLSLLWIVLSMLALGVDRLGFPWTGGS